MLTGSKDGILNIENAPGFLRTGRELIAPGEPKIIKERVISEGGWIERPGCRCFNLYKPPTIIRGNPRKADLWIEHRVWMQVGQCSRGEWEQCKRRIEFAKKLDEEQAAVSTETKPAR